MKPILVAMIWLWSSMALAVPFVQPNGPAVPILFNSSVTASGSQPVVGIISSEVDLIVNITGSPTGTLPTLTFTVAGSDPEAPGTAITGDVSVSTAALNATGTTVLVASPLRSSAVNVSWTIGGTASPTFPGVYVTLVIKSVVNPNLASLPNNTVISGALVVDGGPVTIITSTNVYSFTNAALTATNANISGFFDIFAANEIQAPNISAGSGSIITNFGGPCSCNMVATTTCSCTTTGSTSSSKCFFSLQGGSTAVSAIGCECAAGTGTTVMTCPSTTATFNIFTLN
jgi:hypothetical protein